MADDLKYIDKLVREKMAKHAVASTANNFAAIQRAAFWRNFFKFRFVSLNIYYVVAALLIGFSGMAYYVPSSDNQYVDQEHNVNPDDVLASKTEENSATSSMMAENIAVESSSLTEDQEELRESHIPFVETVVAKNSEAKIQEDIPEINTDTEGLKAISSQNLNNDVVEADLTVAEEVETLKTHEEETLVDIPTTSLEDIAVAGEEMEDAFVAAVENDDADDRITETSNEPIDELDMNKSTSDIDSQVHNEGLFEETNEDLLADFKNFQEQLNFMPSLNLTSSYVDLLKPTYRLLYSDSFDYYVPPSQRHKWQFGAYFAPVYSQAINQTSTPSVNEVIAQKKEVEDPAMTFSTGVSINYQGRKRFGFETGLGLTQLGDWFERGEYFDTKTESYPKYPDGGYFDYDSIPILDIDTYLLTGDSVFVYVSDSLWIDDNTMLDSTIVTKYDGARSNNRYTYIEVPLMVTYHIQGARLGYRIKLGMSANFLLGADGKKLNPENPYEIVDLDYDSPEYRKVNCSVIGGIDMVYRFHKRFSFSTGFLYRRNLFDVYKNYPYSLKYSSTQVTFGLQYYL